MQTLSTNSTSQLQHNGIQVFKNYISSETLPILIDEITQIRQKIMHKVNNMSRPLRTYSDIAERHLGRLDYRCGFSAPIFDKVERLIHPLIRQASPLITFKSYWGVVTSLPGSDPTDMHRDVYPLLNSVTGMNLNPIDIDLPPYYYTVLIPLVQVTEQNGPTEFILKSHRDTIVNKQFETHVPLTLPGDIIIFDGRTMHRGLANKTTEERLVAYITYVANWYHDQTFTVNDYLFPELAIKGH